MSTSFDLTDSDKQGLIRRIDRRRGEGMSVVQACEHEGITESRYFSWRRKFDMGPYLAPEPEPGPPALGPDLDAPASPGPIVAGGNASSKSKPKSKPDVAFLDFRRDSSSIEGQLEQVSRERDELKRILIEVLSGRVKPAELLEGMFRSHLEDRIRASEGVDS
jgi:transposase-like protein